MRVVPYGSIDNPRRPRLRRAHRGSVARGERWPIGFAALMAVLASLALWSVFGAVLY